MSIETCGYNDGKMCQRIGQCYKDVLLDTQAREGGSVSPETVSEEFNPGPYMTVSQWNGFVAQILARIEQCGEKDQVEAKVNEWDDIKRDPTNGYLIDTGSSSLPSGWYTGSGSESE